MAYSIDAKMNINQDYVPATFDAAVTSICNDLDEFSIQFIKHNRPSAIIESTARQLRNDWSLWQKDTPLVQNTLAKFGTCHADDISGLILAAVWATVTNRDCATILNEMAKRFRQHWIDLGIDPKTQEKIL